MPYPNEFSRGDSLWRLVESQSLQNFNGTIRQNTIHEVHTLPTQLSPGRGQNDLLHVIAIDSSTVVHAVQNGYPGAEAALLLLAVLIIDLQVLKEIKETEIPRPRLFHDMEQCHTLDAVLPGRNVVRQDCDDDSPKRFFRQSVYELMSARLEQGHETLLDSMRNITEGRQSDIRCPVEDCEERISPDVGCTECKCERREVIYETDSLRLQERFDEMKSNGEVFSSVRQVLETLVLLNVLRYFERTDSLNFFRTTAFILDGPLAVFGLPAWLKPYVEQEIARLNAKTFEQTGSNILLFGVEKSGPFLDHLKDLDWQESQGPGHRLASQTAFAPDLAYIHRHIVLRDPSAKPYGQATYYGRKLLYKNKSSQHSVLVTPMVNDKSRDLNCTDLEAFPRLGDVLDIMDELSTYLYQDGFAPLVRAHAHAAIPLKTGAALLAQLFETTP